MDMLHTYQFWYSVTLYTMQYHYVRVHIAVLFWVHACMYVHGCTVRSHEEFVRHCTSVNRFYEYFVIRGASNAFRLVT